MEMSTGKSAKRVLAMLCGLFLLVPTAGADVLDDAAALIEAGSNAQA